MNVMAILLFFKCLTQATLVSDRPEARQNDEELVDRRLDEIGTQANVPETQVPSLETVEWALSDKPERVCKGCGIVRATSFTLLKCQNRISCPLIFLHFSGLI